MLSAVHSALLKTRPVSAWVRIRYANSRDRDNFITIWAIFAPSTALTPTFPPCPAVSRFSVFSPNATVPVPSPLVASRSALSKYRKPSAQWPRGTSHFTHLGLVDPRLNCFGQLDVRLATLYQGYTKQDPPPPHPGA
jgi:hypothetical protein